MGERTGTRWLTFIFLPRLAQNWPLRNWWSDAPLRVWQGVTAEANGVVTGLDLSGNSLGVEILIAELGRLSSLEWLDLSNNRLSGEIPPELGNLANLEWLDLSDNRLSGEIPAELGRLSNLRWLDLSDNRLSGEIPAELGNLVRPGMVEP